MPALPTLIIEDSTGTTKETITGITASRTETLIGASTDRDTADYAAVRVDRDDWTAVYPSTVDEINDRFRVDRGDGTLLFRGRFADDVRDGDTVDVQIDSFERDAIDSEPTDAREIYQNVTDATVFTDAINDVATLTTGTVETGASSVSFTFANASQAKKVRDAARPDGQDVVYNPDTTVDFLDRRGADKSHIAISNTNETVVDDLAVEDNSRDPVTHILGLGAQQGGEQVSATATIASYSAGDRKVWRRYINKDVVEQDRMQAIVDRLADVYDGSGRRLFVEATLRNVDVGIGDSVTVDLPDHDINQTMRIIEITEQLANSGRRWLARLTNRTPERGGERKAADDLDRFNSGDEGFVDRDTDSYGWQPVSASVNARRPYPYPDDVVREDVAEVTINSIPYRAYSQGAASGGGAFVTSQSGGTNSDTTLSGGTSSDTTNDAGIGQSVAIGDTTTGNAQSQSATEPIPSTSGTVPQDFFATVEIDATSTTTTINRITLIDLDDNNEILDVRSNMDVKRCTVYFPIDEVEDRLNHDIQAIGELNANPSADWSITVTPSAELKHSHDFNWLHDHEFDWLHDHDVDVPDHTHDPEPGIIDFATETASNVDLIVNGTTVATDINSGTFTETVDISGELTQGDNTIELSSDALGLVNMTVQTQLFRSGGPAP